MYKFVSSQDKRALHKAYNQLYVQDLDKKWDKGVRSCPRLAGAMFPGMTAKKLLTADFKKLVDVYFHYRNYINGLTDIQAKEVNDAAKKVFTYTSFKDNIRDFYSTLIINLKFGIACIVTWRKFLLLTIKENV